jgi:hypothetical protein
MFRKSVDNAEICRVIDEHIMILTSSNEFGAVVRKLAIPYFIGVLGQVHSDVQREIVSVAHVVGVERRRVGGIMINAVVDLSPLDMI